MAITPPTPPPPSSSAPPTASARRSPGRATIGLSVVLAVLAAVALTVLVNFIAYRQLVRFDFTQTGRYSLSQQTQQVLENLDSDHEVIGLFAVTSEPAQQLADLLREYDLRSDRVDVRMIPPGGDPVALDRFYAELQGLYAEQVEPAAETLNRSIEAMSGLLGAATPALADLASALDASDASGANADRLRQLVTVLRQVPPSWTQQAEAWRRLLDEPLPPVASMRSEFSGFLDQVNRQMLAAATAWLDEASSDRSLPPAVRDATIRAASASDSLRDGVEALIDQLATIHGLEEYDQLTRDLRRDGVVVLSERNARVIAFEQMIQPPTQAPTSDQESEYRFLAEEKITGSLISLSMEQRPLAVFVSIGASPPATGPRGAFEYVASRLRSADFEITEWNPSGRPGPMGQPMPSGPPPMPETGQPAVWIVLPAPPPDPRNPMAGSNVAALDQVAGLLRQRLAAGDGVLVSLGNDPGARFGTTNPLADLAGDFGINPQLDRIILVERQEGERRTRATSYHEVRTWPDDHPVAKAIEGLPAIFMQASPIELTTVETDGDSAAAIEAIALATLSSPRTWASTEVGAAGDLESLVYEPEQGADRFIVAAAGERIQETGSARLVVVSDPVWSADQITTYGITGLGAQLGFPEFALYPGNAELFVNSVYWLGHLDHLIAAGSRTQRVPRIGEVSGELLTAYTYGLLLGLPALVLVAGVTVYTIRRSG
ncbi:MAG: Gldg family protein [Phycisphaeraceae bacterium]